MPLQNRVLPSGEITAIPARGTFTGNRGIIHRDDRTLGTARWSHHAWICCTLNWQGRRRQVMTGRNWTELFFLDEAVALAAGHRPCGYCRRADYVAFRDAWGRAFDGPVSAKAMDATLHPARVTRNRQQVTHQGQLSDLPAGCFVTHNDRASLWHDHRLWPYSPEGYGSPIVAPLETMVTVLTP